MPGDLFVVQMGREDQAIHVLKRVHRSNKSRTVFNVRFYRKRNALFIPLQEITVFNFNFKF